MLKGMNMASGKERKWFVYGIAHLVMYSTDHGNLNIPEDYVAEDGFHLGEFVADIRERYAMGVLSETEQKRLEGTGLAMDKDMQDWETMYRMAADYRATHGVLPEAGYRTEDNVLLGAWICRQQVVFERLNDRQKERLEVIGIGISDRLI